MGFVGWTLKWISLQWVDCEERWYVCNLLSLLLLFTCYNIPLINVHNGIRRLRIGFSEWLAVSTPHNWAHFSSAPPLSSNMSTHSSYSLLFIVTTPWNCFAVFTVAFVLLLGHVLIFVVFDHILASLILISHLP